MIRLEVQYYLTEDETCPYMAWLKALKDRKAAAAISARLNRIALGSMGDCKALGDGIFELRVHLGPGYRVYFGYDGPKLVIVLAAGAKNTQARDINAAKKMWEDYLGRKNG